MTKSAFIGVLGIIAILLYSDWTGLLPRVPCYIVSVIIGAGVFILIIGVVSLFLESRIQNTQKNEGGIMFVPVTIWNADIEDQIEIQHTPVYTEQAAYEFANHEVDHAELKSNPVPHILLTLKNGNCIQVQDDDIKILVIRPEKLANMGQPIDIRAAGGREKILDTIGDPAYTVSESDMILSDLKIIDLLNKHGEGYRLSSLAYGINKTEAIYPKVIHE